MAGFSPSAMRPISAWPRYICATAARSWGLDPVASILLGTLSASVLGAVFGAIAIRRQGIYFSMITLALAQIVYFVALQAPFTGGEDGIQGVPRGRLLGLIDLTSDAALYVLVAVVFLGGLLIIYRIVHSPFGQVLRAIRENENRALSLGYRVDHYRLAVFTMSATLSGLAGATKALVFQLASLTDVHWTMSGEVVLMTLIGGMGTIFGPDRRRLRLRRLGILPGLHRLLGHGRGRGGLRGLRAGLSRGYRRRPGTAAAPAALRLDSTVEAP